MALRKLAILLAGTGILIGMVVAAPAQAAMTRKPVTVEQSVLHTERQVLWALRHNEPNSPRCYQCATPTCGPCPSPHKFKCQSACKKWFREIKGEYQWMFINKVCATISTWLCKHPYPIEKAQAMDDVCLYTSDCPRFIATAVYKNYDWIFHHGGNKQLAEVWKCGAKPFQPCHPDCYPHYYKGCKGVTNWLPFIDLGLNIASYGCIILLDGIGAIVCSAATAVIKTVLDDVMAASKRRGKGTEAFKDGLITAAPFFVSLLKEIFKRPPPEALVAPKTLKLVHG